MKESTYELKWNGTTFKIGQRVQTTSNSDYAGLSGVIWKFIPAKIKKPTI